MWMHIGLFVYLLISGCSSLGYVAYPLDDNNKKEHRVISVCTKYGKDQTEEIYLHELIHACVHNHYHSFKTDKELQEHISIIQKQLEEPFVGSLSACVDNALENKDANKFLGIK